MPTPTRDQARKRALVPRCGLVAQTVCPVCAQPRALRRLLSAGRPGLASTANPIAAVGAILPACMAVRYLLTAVGGMVTGDIMDVYRRDSA